MTIYYPYIYWFFLGEIIKYLNKIIAFMLIISSFSAIAAHIESDIINADENELTYFEFLHLEALFKEASIKGKEIALEQAKKHNGEGFYAMLFQFLQGVTEGWVRTFNWSLAPVELKGEQKYLIAVRMMMNQRRQAIGPWKHNWNDPALCSATLFFTANIDFSQIEYLPPKDNISEGLYEQISPKTLFIIAQDTRLTKIGEKIFAYNSKSSKERTYFAYEIDINNDQFDLINPIVNPGPIGNNWALVTLDNKENSFVHLDWFTKEGVSFKKVSQSNREEGVLTYRDADYPILGDPTTMGPAGYNSEIMPHFSFGSNHIEKDGYLVGVGHLKIRIDEEPYRLDSKIDNFRKQLAEDFRAKFGPNYFPHHATYGFNTTKQFIYQLYFYKAKFDDQNNLIEMHISDGFLPINIKQEAESKHIFSLIFPMGVAMRNDELLVSCGYGDFYSVLLTFNIEEVLNLCRHDISFLDLEKFRYHIMMAKPNSSAMIAPSLRDLVGSN